MLSEKSSRVVDHVSFVLEVEILCVARYVLFRPEYYEP